MKKMHSLAFFVLLAILTNGETKSIRDDSSNKLINSCLEYFPGTVTFSKWKCQVGKRGPCDYGQVFSSVPDAGYSWMDISNDCPDNTPEDCEEIDFNQTEWFDRRKPLDEVKSHHGVCVWADPKHPCRGFPSGFRFNAEENRCQLADDFRNPNCKNGFTFYALNETHGHCKCAYGIWSVDGKCYRTYSQGPCDKDHWMVEGNEGEVTCQPVKCKIEGNQLDWPMEKSITCNPNDDEMTAKFETTLRFAFDCSFAAPDVSARMDDNNVQCDGEADAPISCYREPHTSNSFFLLCPLILN